MVYDVQKKTFREKTVRPFISQTKFEIILYTEKGNKKVGEIRFDVSAYLNERHKNPKEYELALDKCPDKNARLTFKLTATVEEKISADAIRQSWFNLVTAHKTLLILKNWWVKVPKVKFNSSQVRLSQLIKTMFPQGKYLNLRNRLELLKGQTLRLLLKL